MKTIIFKERYMHGRFGMGPEWWHGRLKKHGCRITIPRQEILKVLNKTQEHLSAEAIYLEVHKRYPSVGLTTVYRTLELLAKMGVVSKLDFPDGKARYELAEGPKGVMQHNHLVCNNCGQVVDYVSSQEGEKEYISRTEKELSKRYNFKITNHRIRFYGLCKRCAK